MLTEAMLTPTSYAAPRCKYGLLSQGTAPRKAWAGFSPLHADKHPHTGLCPLFLQMCLGKRDSDGVFPGGTPVLPLPCPAPSQQHHGWFGFSCTIEQRPTGELGIFMQGTAKVGWIKGWPLHKWPQKQRGGRRQSFLASWSITSTKEGKWKKYVDAHLAPSLLHYLWLVFFLLGSRDVSDYWLL